MAAMAPFGGGMGSSGQVCGTLAGALAVIGFTMGKTGPEERDHRKMWKLSNTMVRRFADICRPYGGINCAQIAGVDWKNPAAVKAFYRDPDSRRRNCVQVIRETSLALHALVTEHLERNG